MTDPIRSAVYGHLVGDAIGVPYEFLPPDPGRVVELRGQGTHGQPAGTWSDDGALMLALLDSLVSVGFDPEDQGRRALAWTDSGAYAAGGQVFDIGFATASAMSRLRAGVPATDAGGAPESEQQGNGSLMRILPVALLEVPADDAELVERAHLASRVTHGARRCQVACALYVLVVRSMLERPAGTSDDPEVALAVAADRLLAAYRDRPAEASVLRELLAHRAQVRKPGGGWVLDSFWSAWSAFAESASYRETIERCVRYGRDTDTTAAIAGGLAGLRWGLDGDRGGIPAEWLAGLRDRELVDEILGRAAALGPQSS